jgi:hypothetical protein
MYKGKFTLHKKDYQDFLKRLRKQLPDRLIKYVVCGEYGSKNNRPHYHFILFGLNIDDFNDIQKAWGKGLINVGNVQPNSIAYVFKYSIKGDKKHRDWRQTKQFIAMSKGLGETFAFNITEVKVHGIDKNGKSFTRIRKIRTPKLHFTNKLNSLVQQPFYNIPSQTGGTVKMSVPRFYIKSANYDTTELTQTYLDKMAQKYKGLSEQKRDAIVKKEAIQVQEHYKVMTELVKYSISKEKF